VAQSLAQAMREHLACQTDPAPPRQLLWPVPGVGQKGVNYLLVLLYPFQALTAFLAPLLHESGKMATTLCAPSTALWSHAARPKSKPSSLPRASG
jgi:hypothetical protein